MTLHSIEKPSESMFSGYRRIFWGLLLMLFHINLGTIQILPNFVGYMLIASGTGCFKKAADSRGLRRASILATIMVVVAVFEFLCSLSGKTFTSTLYLTVLSWSLMNVLMMVLMYDILNASACILRLNNNSTSADGIDKRLHIYLVLNTIISMAVVFSIVFSESEVFIWIVICSTILRLWLASIFAGLKRQYAGAVFESENNIQTI